MGRKHRCRGAVTSSCTSRDIPKAKVMIYHPRNLIITTQVEVLSRGLGRVCARVCVWIFCRRWCSIGCNNGVIALKFNLADGVFCARSRTRWSMYEHLSLGSNQVWAKPPQISKVSCVLRDGKYSNEGRCVHGFTMWFREVRKGLHCLENDVQ